MKINNILTECNADTLIAKTLLFPNKDYTHKKGCNNVLKSMREDLNDEAAFGIIDDDKSVPKYLKETFHQVKKHNEQLSILKHNDRPHYIVKLSKAAEDFIIKNAEKCEIALSDFNLPSDMKKLKKRTKPNSSLTDPDLRRLILALYQNDTSDFKKLKQWILLFKENPYGMDEKDL